jgi:tRNA nucleotidyltransferase (CCA-adding enzyme)
VLGLAACLIGAETIPELAGFTARERAVIAAAATNFGRLRAGGGSDADLYRRFHHHRPETAELLAAAGDEGAKRWLDHVRHRRLAINGTDLVAAGLSGAAVGEGLERATLAMLDGHAPDRERQLAVARQTPGL